MDVDTNVEVLYDFEYKTKDGQKVSIKGGEKLLLLKKTNEDWWQVIRSKGRAFYVPSTYVKILGENEPIINQREDDRSVSPPKNFTVSINVKPPPMAKSKVMITSDEISIDKLSERYGRIPATPSYGEVKKRSDTLAEANILDDMSSSLVELAKEIEFVPKQSPLKYSGSFKTKFERKMPSRSFSGSTPDLTCDSEPVQEPVMSHTKSMEQLPDLDNNIVPTHRTMGNNIRLLTEKLEKKMLFMENNNLKDSSDSVGSGGVKTSVETLDASSSESIDITKPRVTPVAKPRRFKPTAQEVIYANCFELARELRRRSPSRKSSENENSPVESPHGTSTLVDTETQLFSYTHSSPVERWHTNSNGSEKSSFSYKEKDPDSFYPLASQSQQSSSQASLETSSPNLEKPDMSIIFNKISHVELAARRQRTAKAYSLIVPNKKDDIEFRTKPSKPKQGAPLLEESLHYTKISDSGKRVRKSWNSVHVVLTAANLAIYKDLKAAQSLKPELTLDLCGAEVSTGEKVSGRKHVLLVSTQSKNIEVALQCADIHNAMQWGMAINDTISKLPPMPEVSNSKLGSISESQSEEVGKKGTNIGRSKSVNFKNKDDSMEDLGVSPAERQVKIKARLRKFFHKRPTMESLVKKGIWKDEPVFGCYLEQACSSGGGSHRKVPQFVQKCVALIESTEENMKTDGLYRASGNLSQIQKIRLQIDQNNYSALEREEDVHVLTGALKLFFRELKEPLIPYKLFPKAIKASTTINKKERLNMFIDIVKNLPSANRDTLKFLLQHLLRVTQYQDHNRMHVANVAIVFGPTLMWPEQESLNMALDLMQQNMVIEALLNDYHQIFK